MKKSPNFVSAFYDFFMKWSFWLRVFILLMAWGGSQAICFGQNIPFEQSMNRHLFDKINSERAANNKPELKYYFTMQNTLDVVAENLNTKFCSCYGDTFVTETLYLANNVDEVIADLSEWRDKNKNPLLKEGITKVTIGIRESPEGGYNFAIRTF